MSSNPNNDGKSDYALIRDGGWDNRKHFMESYDLKIWNDDDIQEGRKIIEAMHEFDRQQAANECQQAADESHPIEAEENAESCGDTGDHNREYNDGYAEERDVEPHGGEVADGGDDGHGGYEEGQYDGADGYGNGYGDGYGDGHDDGYGDGYDDGYGDGYDDGHGDGYEDGYGNDNDDY